MRAQGDRAAVRCGESSSRASTWARAGGLRRLPHAAGGTGCSLGAARCRRPFGTNCTSSNITPEVPRRVSAHGRWIKFYSNAAHRAVARWRPALSGHAVRRLAPRSRARIPTRSMPISGRCRRCGSPIGRTTCAFPTTTARSSSAGGRCSSRGGGIQAGTAAKSERDGNRGAYLVAGIGALLGCAIQPINALGGTSEIAGAQGQAEIPMQAW